MLPWAGTYHGHAEVARFSEVLNGAMSYEQFAPREYIAQGDEVVEVVQAHGHAIATGRPFASEIVRIWTLRDGKAVRVRSYYDTAAYVTAVTGV